MKRMLVRFLAAAALVAPLAVPAPAPAQSGRDLARISAYLNGLRTAEGDFVQIAPNGETSEGRFFISRPGKIRFEYTPPNPSLVIADGTWVTIFDLRDCNRQTVPLSETPLAILLRNRVNLAEEGAVTDISRSDGQMRVTAVNPGDPGQGSLTLIFGDNPLELRQWVVADKQGQRTTVALSAVRRGIETPSQNFIPDFVAKTECQGSGRRTGADR